LLVSVAVGRQQCALRLFLSPRLDGRKLAAAEAVTTHESGCGLVLHCCMLLHVPCACTPRINWC
jgi:hypothetical protein